MACRPILTEMAIWTSAPTRRPTSPATSSVRYNGQNGTQADTSGTVNGAAQSFLIGNLKFTVTDLKSGATTKVNIRAFGGQGLNIGAIWEEDGNPSYFNSETGHFSVGTPVVISNDTRPPTFSVSGNVFNDSNSNTTKDSGETGVPGVTVYVDLNNDKIFQAATEPSTATDSTGNYTITGLPRQFHAIRRINLRQTNLPSGASSDFPHRRAGRTCDDHQCECGQHQLR